jgi:hypothetical protein
MKLFGDHQCGFWRNTTTTDQIFGIRQILEKKLEWNETVYKQFVNFQNDSNRREIL